MIIKVKQWEVNPPYYEPNSGFTVKVETEEGEKEYSLYEGEPEDMIFGRNLPSLSSLEEIIELAYNAGANGEELKKIDIEE